MLAMKSNFGAFAFLLALVGLASPARPEALTVVNPGFEAPALVDGGYAVGSIPGWTISAGAQAGYENPVDSRFDNTTDPKLGLPEGRQFGWLNSIGSISQTLAASAEANKRYTLQVSVGVGKGGLAGPYSVEIHAGDITLGAASPPMVVGSFVTAVVVADVLPGDPAVGKPLSIVLSKSTTVFGAQTCFDHVTLSASAISLNPARLVAHWTFDEAVGLVAADTTGLHNGQLTSTGADFVSGGVSGNALQLDRTLNGMVQASPIKELVTNDFTVVAWAKLPVGDTTGSTFLFSQHEAWYENGCLVLLSTSPGWGSPGKASFMLQNGNFNVTSTSTVNDGQWHQIVVGCVKGGDMTIRVDGGLLQARRSAPVITDRNAPALIGGLYGIDVSGVAKGSYTGLIDDVQIYAAALSDTQVEYLYRNPGKDLAEASGLLAIIPNGGDFLDSMDVTLTSAVATGEIRYTLDGSEPLIASAAYAGPIALHSTTTVRARLFVNGFPASDIVSATFTKLPAIGFIPTGGLFTNVVDVTLLNRLGLGTIYYTADGSEPNQGATVYAGPIKLTTAATIRAIVMFNGFPVSEVCSASYARVYAIDDGIPASWREHFFGPGYLTDPRVAAGADPDGDGWTNQFEYGAGTDPTDKNSAPIVTGIRAIPSVSWTSVPGLTYQVLRKDSVNQPEWDIVVSAFKASESLSTFIDTNAAWTAIYLVRQTP